jgi:undecaprenyl diphosphate synthase
MTISGHRQGLDVAKAMALAAFDRGVKVFTMYAFSTENWTRAEEEVGYLMELFYGLATDEMSELTKKNVRFRVIGSRSGLSPRLVAALEAAEKESEHNTAGTIAICLNYGGEQEIADAATSLIASGHTGVVTPAEIAAHLYAPDIPPVDLIIRTSGEHRISGFMLWRAAYAEFYAVAKHWPEFTEADLDAALTDYAKRQRRFGG